MSAGPELWTIAAVAEHLKVTTSTVRSYAARGQMPPPDGRIGRTPWWNAETIRAWRRPGRGARTDLPPAEDEDVEAGAGA